MIDPSNRLAALIRAQFSAQLRTPAQAQDPSTQSHSAGAVAGADPAASESAASDTVKTDAQIQQLVALRVRTLSPEDPHRRRKAFRLFLEGVLMQEFGRDRLDDKGFGELIDTVMQRMEGDAQLLLAMQDAGDALLANAAPRAAGSEASTPGD